MSVGHRYDYFANNEAIIEGPPAGLEPRVDSDLIVDREKFNRLLLRTLRAILES